MRITIYNILFLLIGGYLLNSCNNTNTITTKSESNLLETKNNNSTVKDTTPSLQSEITCPKCGHKSIEVLPTEVCQIKYTCKSCSAVLYPKDGDCCVFCTYGDHKCPSKQ